MNNNAKETIKVTNNTYFSKFDHNDALYQINNSRNHHIISNHVANVNREATPGIYNHKRFEDIHHVPE